MVLPSKPGSLKNPMRPRKAASRVGGSKLLEPHYKKTEFNAALGTAGGTMSENNAISAFFFKKEDLDAACENGELRFKWKSCHGHPYRLFMCDDLKELDKKTEKDPVLVLDHERRIQKERIQTSVVELQNIKRELAGWEEREKKLLEKKAKLEEFLKSNNVRVDGTKKKEAKTSLLSSIVS